jgi:hypothetical protein
MGFLQLFSNPKVAFTIFAGWIMLLVIILQSMGGFSEKFLHFGPSTDPKTQTEFLGTKVDTWGKVITIYVLGFFSVCFSTYYYDIFGSWLTNSVKDHKEKTLKTSKQTAYFLTILDPFLSHINGILSLFVTLTLQLQFIIPQIIAELLVTVFSSHAFLSKKTKFK